MWSAFFQCYETEGDDEVTEDTSKSNLQSQTKKKFFFLPWSRFVINPILKPRLLKLEAGLGPDLRIIYAVVYVYTYIYRIVYFKEKYEKSKNGSAN